MYRVEVDTLLNRIYTLYAENGNLIIRTRSIKAALEAGEKWRDENKKT